MVAEGNEKHNVREQYATKASRVTRRFARVEPLSGLTARWLWRSYLRLGKIGNRVNACERRIWQTDGLNLQRITSQSRMASFQLFVCRTDRRRGSIRVLHVDDVEVHMP